MLVPLRICHLALVELPLDERYASPLKRLGRRFDYLFVLVRWSGAETWDQKRVIGSLERIRNSLLEKPADPARLVILPVLDGWPQEEHSDGRLPAALSLCGLDADSLVFNRLGIALLALKELTIVVDLAGYLSSPSATAERAQKVAEDLRSLSPRYEIRKKTPTVVVLRRFPPIGPDDQGVEPLGAFLRSFGEKSVVLLYFDLPGVFLGYQSMLPKHIGVGLGAFQSSPSPTLIAHEVLLPRVGDIVEAEGARLEVLRYELANNLSWDRKGNVIDHSLGSYLQRGGPDGARYRPVKTPDQTVRDFSELFCSIIDEENGQSIIVDCLPRSVLYTVAFDEPPELALEFQRKGIELEVLDLRQISTTDASDDGGLPKAKNEKWADTKLLPDRLSPAASSWSKQIEALADKLAGGIKDRTVVVLARSKPIDLVERLCWGHSDIETMLKRWHLLLSKSCKPKVILFASLPNSGPNLTPSLLEPFRSRLVKPAEESFREIVEYFEIRSAFNASDVRNLVGGYTGLAFELMRLYEGRFLRDLPGTFPLMEKRLWQELESTARASSMMIRGAELTSVLDWLNPFAEIFEFLEDELGDSRRGNASFVLQDLLAARFPGAGPRKDVRDRLEALRRYGILRPAGADDPQLFSVAVTLPFLRYRESRNTVELIYLEHLAPVGKPLWDCLTKRSRDLVAMRCAFTKERVASTGSADEQQADTQEPPPSRVVVLSDRVPSADLLQTWTGGAELSRSTLVLLAGGRLNYASEAGLGYRLLPVVYESLGEVADRIVAFLS